MNDFGAVFWIVVVLVAVGVCCYLAEAASGNRASPAWGLLGPLGLVIAAIRGVHARLEDLRLPASADRAPPARPSGTGEPLTRCEHCRADVPRHRTVCPACGESME